MNQPRDHQQQQTLQRQTPRYIIAVVLDSIMRTCFIRLEMKRFHAMSSFEKQRNHHFQQPVPSYSKQC